MTTLPQRLQERADWLESRSFAQLDGVIEREAAGEIEWLRAIVDPIGRLRREDGDSVSIAWDNPDFDGPNNMVTCFGNWCGFDGRSFHGNSLAHALDRAVAARKAAEKES